MTKTTKRPRGAVLTPATSTDVPITPTLARELQRVAQALSGLAANVMAAKVDPGAEAPPEPMERPPAVERTLSKTDRQVLAMHKRGKTNPEIAAATGLRDRDVSAIVRANGLRAHRRPLPPMTAKEALEIQRQAKAGKSVQEIARATGRPEGTVFLLLHGHHRLSKAAPPRKARAKKADVQAPVAKVEEAPAPAQEAPAKKAKK